jgi:hypothetical protein
MRELTTVTIIDLSGLEEGDVVEVIPARAYLVNGSRTDVVTSGTVFQTGGTYRNFETQARQRAKTSP